MDIVFIGNKTIYTLKLPSQVEGSFLLKDPLTAEDLLVIEAELGRWVIFSTSDAKIVNQKGVPITRAIVANNDYFFIDNDKHQNVIYCQNSFDNSFKMYQIGSKTEYSFGQSENMDVIYHNPYIKDCHFKLIYLENEWQLYTSENTFIYVNGGLVNKTKINLMKGDIIFVYGLKLIVLDGFLFINNPADAIEIKSPDLKAVVISEKPVPYEEVKELDFYKDDDYYFNTPRIRRFITPYELTIANPPTIQEPQETPLILTLGPMLTTGIISLLSFFNLLFPVISGRASLVESGVQIISIVVMLTATFLWPSLMRKYQKKLNIKREELRHQKYLAYLEDKRQEIKAETINQTAILKENLLPLSECYETIINKRRTLWERKLAQRDFLTIRVGIGTTPIEMNITYTKTEFTIEKDPLQEVANKMVADAKMLHNVPIGYCLATRVATAVMGKNTMTRPFINNVLLQLIAAHSFDELKIVIFTDESNRVFWDSIKDLPHLFSDGKTNRFYATDSEGSKDLSNYLEQVLLQRISDIEQTQVVVQEGEEKQAPEKMVFTPFYLIITDNYPKIRKLGICDKLFKINSLIGFSFLIIDDRLSHLPSKCNDFIMLDRPESSILSSNGNEYYQKKFTDEITDTFNLKKCVASLANVPIEFEQDLRYLPTMISFLEMYKVGKAEQLNIINRWQLNDPTKSLRAPLGVNDQSNLIYLDLHEKAHGPHGLIAGMTGSGKSEFIITYILSMAINYSPDEVSFILIDYKGGGLAGAFENKTNNIRLPHLAGTITNLDKNELNRTLVSIQSELKRRQSVLNEAREILGESTIDIYKYQSYYRAHKIKDPMPHLFIICDEFAELKVQQPDFMDNLISAARIGRSLGVHLILATQKPSGVVDDQIWSNTRFRVCLKVADKTDSNEIIKCPAAAEIKNAGRFYLQVGYNEIFVLGQSAWCGAPYLPSDTIKKEYDRSISIIDDAGNVIKNLSDDIGKKRVIAQGDELANILKYIVKLATKANIKADNLWLASIPSFIYLNDLIAKYNFKSQWVTAVIGEYDDPASQFQSILTIPLDANSNTLVYGLSGISREMFLRTFIYSCVTLYSSKEVNFYIFDFGSETFKLFTKFPHVGDVVLAPETEKVTKLLKLIENEIIERKKRLVNYNGDYFNFRRNNSQELPVIVVIINNYDAFKEMYNSYEEEILQLGREGKRYGIILIVATASQSGLYSRFLKNFDRKFVLDMNSKDEYIDILGKIGDVYPADYPGRGLFKTEKAFEFQTARFCSDDNLIEFINQKAAEAVKLNSYEAPRVPVLPERITITQMMKFLTNLSTVPIGIVKDTLKPCLYNLTHNRVTLISANETKPIRSFIISLLIMFKRINNIVTVLFDFENNFEEAKEYANSYCHQDFEKFVDDIIEFINQKIINTKFEAILIITGIEKYKEIISDNQKKKLNRLIVDYPNCALIYGDDAFKLKKMVFEPWYLENVLNINGIWIGSGIASQSVLRLNTIDNKYNVKLPNNYAWVFKNGEGELIKLVEGDNEDEK